MNLSNRILPEKITLSIAEDAVKNWEDIVFAADEVRRQVEVNFLILEN